MASKKVTTHLVPLTKDTLDIDSIKFGPIRINKEYNTRNSPVSYSGDGAPNNKLAIIIKGCQVITVRPADEKNNSPSIYVNIHDAEFIDIMHQIEQCMVDYATSHNEQWFDNKDLERDDIEEMLKPMVTHNEKYKSHNANINLAKTVKIFDGANQLEGSAVDLLRKNQLVDICIEITNAKPAKKTLKLGHNAVKLKIVGESEGSVATPNHLDPETFDPSNIKLTKKDTHEMGGSFSKLQYDGSSPNFKMTNVTGFMFKNENKETKDGTETVKISYSLSIRLDNEKYRNMFEKLNKSIYTELQTRSIEFWGGKKMKSDAMMKNVYKPIISYNQEDTKKIEAGQAPQYPPSIWIKVYFSEKDQFAGRFVNSADGKKIDMNNYIRKPFNISELTFYSRHIWFGNVTTVNFTVNNCKIEDSTPDYDMDGIGSTYTPKKVTPTNDEGDDDVVSDSNDEDD